jgi:hypothetical protein
MATRGAWRRDAPGLACSSNLTLSFGRHRWCGLSLDRGGPTDASAYTHKLDVGGVGLLYPFAGMDSTAQRAASLRGIW